MILSKEKIEEWRKSLPIWKDSARKEQITNFLDTIDALRTVANAAQDVYISIINDALDGPEDVEVEQLGDALKAAGMLEVKT